MSQKENLSRAAIVRQRRAERKAQEAKEAAEKSVLKPVAPIRPSKKTNFVGAKARKVKIQRYEATAIAPANDGLRVSEGLRAPTMPVIRLEWRAASAALVILLGVALYLLFTSPYFMVASPKISGNQYLAVEEINGVLNLSGKTIFTLIPKNLEHDLLLAHPGLADVEVTLSLPNAVSVTVRERQPAIIWQQDGKSAWIDSNGIAFRASAYVEGIITVTALGPPPAPVVDASLQDKFAPPPYIAPETVAALQALITHVPPGTPIVYDPKTGLGWIDSRGWTVQLGDITEEIGLKLRLYETIVNWFAQNNIRPILVNLEYPHAPYYRTEP
ncbi:MAG: FtsQ-type POTRA domain-containing protein [Anaerolineae bacterium]|nr:FtsQ-type POTRA domain-containing protein [Anaerolineae bacterium]MBT4310696.1 FtsQ-type POTRA domain-containing protein [Anaerolineae bacterium]MBT4457872.1 FtsQ-type POTRA domain-containing protein [Anaerolineae bacterium]MBT4842061.1 FtsQ-type POTRA domain-containing protein [Anaerolineae bacterium]MBT6060306.1 FtsQ-type POTRA domain-containing protein [Anaerolineae bacterium]